MLNDDSDCTYYFSFNSLELYTYFFCFVCSQGSSSHSLFNSNFCSLLLVRILGHICEAFLFVFLLPLTCINHRNKKAYPLGCSKQLLPLAILSFLQWDSRYVCIVSLLFIQNVHLVKNIDLLSLNFASSVFWMCRFYIIFII